MRKNSGSSLDTSALDQGSFLGGVVGVAGASLLIAWGAETLFDLPPCVLCMYQRYVYAGILAWALVWRFLPVQGRPWGILGCVLLFLINAGLAFYQVGVEEHWFPLPAVCQQAAWNSVATIEELEKQLRSQPYAPCNKVLWQFLGLSMAGYNFLFSLIMGGGCLWGLVKLPRSKNKA